MTTYLVPCGRSVHASLESSGKFAPAGVRVKPFRDAEKRWWPQTRLADGDSAVASWATALQLLADDVRLPEWDIEVCAETHTLAKRTDKVTLSALLDRSDRVVLLASDTDEGMAAALSVAYIISGGDTGRMRCVTAPTDDFAALRFPESMPAGKVTVVRIGQLAPGSTGLRRAVGGIGRVLRAALDLHESMEVHLTGGYKITLLHTLAMTEIAYSCAPHLTSAWYIFDEGAGVVPIGLRRFPPEYLQHMRAELSRVKRGEPLMDDGTFKGLAWEPAAGGIPRLTEFGEGYLAVLGGPEVPGAGDGAR